MEYFGAAAGRRGWHARAGRRGLGAAAAGEGAEMVIIVYQNDLLSPCTNKK